MKTRTERFEAQLEKLTDERGEDYGHPADNFARIVGMQEYVKDCPDPLVRHALDMILVKVARLVESPDHFDSACDIAGYAKNICMVLDRNDKR